GLGRFEVRDVGRVVRRGEGNGGAADNLEAHLRRDRLYRGQRGLAGRALVDEDEQAVVPLGRGEMLRARVLVRQAGKPDEVVRAVVFRGSDSAFHQLRDARGLQDGVDLR